MKRDLSKAQPTTIVEQIASSLQPIVTRVPRSAEEVSPDPVQRAKSLTLQASVKSALVSGTLAIPPGPIGMVTILPDLLTIWKIQRQLVSDIAAANGKSSLLGSTEMIYCLFRHAASHAVRELVVRVGERVVVRRATLRATQRVLRRVGVSVTQRAAGRTISRWIPVARVLGIGGYAFYDTTRVGKTAMAFFQKDLVPDA